MKYLRRGDIWLAELSPIVGHEQDGRRPVLVISADKFNAGPSELVAIVPLTTKQRTTLNQVRVSAAEAGTRMDSFILCDQLRVISHERLVHRIGAVPDSIIKEVEYHVGMMLQMPIQEMDFLD